MVKEIVGLDKYSYLDTHYDLKNLEILLKSFKAVGSGATVLNGYSYKRILGDLLFYTPVESLDGADCLVYRLVYLPDYDTSVGFEKCNVASPERNICDYLMYPDKLHAYSNILDAMEGYLEDHKDFSKVYEMMEYFNIDVSKFEDWLKYLYHGSNCMSSD